MKKSEQTPYEALRSQLIEAHNKVSNAKWAFITDISFSLPVTNPNPCPPIIFADEDLKIIIDEE